MEKNSVIKKYVTDEMSKFKNLFELENFVNSLSTEKIYRIGQWLSDWRKNGLYSFILSSPDTWSVNTVSISNIKIAKVNEKVNALLERHNYLLDEISKDNDICSNDEFRSQGEIKSKSLIARKNGDIFEVIDGNHRAVRLACGGKREFKLIYF